jgi:hypothetical protein
VDAIVYVLRGFANEKIISTRPEINSFGDKEILDTELVLKDLETIENRIAHLGKDIKANKKEAIKEAEVLKRVKEMLEKGDILSEREIGREDKEILNKYQLLSLKPRIYLLNGRDEKAGEEFKKRNLPFLMIDILEELEAEDFSEEERKSLGLAEESALDLLIKKSYELLDLITFFTILSDETRAWTLKKGRTAPEAGGVIHTDFEKNFIKAEVINWQKLLQAGGFAEAREKGLVRTEGKNYIVQDGDIIQIKHGA